MQSHEILLRKISDTSNEYWALAATGAVQTWALIAGNKLVPVAIPRTDGEANNLFALPSSLNSSSFNISNGIAETGTIGDLQLAIFTPQTHLQSLRPNHKIDDKGHKKTGDNGNNPLPYSIPIDDPETLSFPSGDDVFKDIVQEPRNVLVRLQTVPEPGVLSLMV